MREKYFYSMEEFPNTIKEMRRKAGKEARSGEAKAPFLDDTSGVIFNKSPTTLACMKRRAHIWSSTQSPKVSLPYPPIFCFPMFASYLERLNRIAVTSLLFIALAQFLPASAAMYLPEEEEVGDESCAGPNPVLTPIPLSKSAPAYRIIDKGCNLEGRCKTTSCRAYGKKAWAQVGFLDGQEQWPSSTFSTKWFVCPLCKQKMDYPFNLGFYECNYQIDGEFYYTADYPGDRRAAPHLPVLGSANGGLFYTCQEVAGVSWEWFKVTATPLIK